MIIVKLLVLFIVFHIVNTTRDIYCEVCRNHTLCKYPMKGPSPQCRGYDETALLTSNDAMDIVNRINEKRNFVALGLSKLLPQAANMKKISWSVELAALAQRWVDQCDQNLRPDKEDQCRDLAGAKVGQNIATVLGPSPGLNVRSFVDMWLMLTLDYTGSVTFYNQSQDHKTNYFTQLIWAVTDAVGCGKARFYIGGRETMDLVERLVCNFSPKGNIHGTPVYAIGYAATQCSKNMTSDDKFSGLCHDENYKTVTKASSLLRILNLSNNSVKQELDPIRNNLKQIIKNSNEVRHHRNQKTRHVYLNNTYGAAMKLANPNYQMQSFWSSPINNSDILKTYHHQQERGHSRVYHGYDPQKNNFDSVHTRNTEQDFRRYGYTTEVMNTYFSNDYRKYDRVKNHQCTRKVVAAINDCMTTECATNQCTRGHKNCQQSTKSCQQTLCRQQDFPITTGNHVFPHELCSCNTQKQPECNLHKQNNWPPALTLGHYNLGCQYPTPDCPTTTRCPKLHRKQGVSIKDETKNAEFQYYDAFPGAGLRSGDQRSLQQKSWPMGSTQTDKRAKGLTRGRESDQVKTIIGYSKFNEPDRDYLYSSFDSSERKRRELDEQITFKPFWQMDEFNNKKSTGLKSIRYTTLNNKKNKKSRRTTVSTKLSTNTESITIKLKDKSTIQRRNRDRISEKYLSFDELMHLRKLSTVDLDYDARRKGDVLREATTIQTTTEVTANTPFIRKKHCTRKLTCTWTALSMTGGDGAIIPGDGGGNWMADRGSRTPPGYVDGCTRTSTCTRDFMDRNKISTSSGDSSVELTPEDEDYCEKRSLNVQRRNSENSVTIHNIDYQEAYTDIPTATPKFNYATIIDSNEDSTSSDNQNYCICYDESARIKRNEMSNYDQLLTNDCHGIRKMSNPKKHMPYSDLYSYIYRKISQDSKNNNNKSDCPCNDTKAHRNYVFLIIMIQCMVKLTY